MPELVSVPGGTLAEMLAALIAAVERCQSLEGNAGLFVVLIDNFGDWELIASENLHPDEILSASFKVAQSKAQPEANDE